MATTVREALAAEAAGADAIVAQGMEAGGHRGAFRAEDAKVDLVGLVAPGQEGRWGMVEDGWMRVVFEMNCGIWVLFLGVLRLRMLGSRS